MYTRYVKIWFQKVVTFFEVIIAENPDNSSISMQEEYRNLRVNFGGINTSKWNVCQNAFSIESIISIGINSRSDYQNVYLPLQTVTSI